MVTPVFRILDYAQALAFYVDWLGFRIDWEEPPAEGAVYVQVSRGEVVLHLSNHPDDGSPGARAWAEVRGLPAYHRLISSKESPPMRPGLAPAHWNARVLAMEIVDPFGNRLVFCEPAGLQA